MFELTRGNLLEADVEAVVNTVNTEGIMGKGIALQFRKAYPENYEAYRRACKAGEVWPGHMFVFDRHTLTLPRYIINFPTKRHWVAHVMYGGHRSRANSAGGGGESFGDPVYCGAALGLRAGRAPLAGGAVAHKAAFEILGEVRDVETIAVGRGVYIRRYLERAYGRGRWRKMKGIATVRLTDGTICEAEIHWFEAHGIGRKDFKIKRVIR